MRHRGHRKRLKRLYFLGAIAAVQIVLGSLTLLAAAQPLRTSQDVLVSSGGFYHFEFGILGAGWLSGNLSDLGGRSFTLFVFDDHGFALFRGGSNSAPPLYQQSGTGVRFDLSLPGSGQYHVVAVNLPGRLPLQIHVDLVAYGLRTEGAIVAIIVLVGGLALVGASLMLSVWSWRRAPAVGDVGPVSSPDPAPDPQPDPAPSPPAQDPAADPPDDNTRIY